MNKTININLGGFFFHIDENAYQKLKRYLDAIARSLSDDPQGKNEIISDIESRISELLSERITDARQVVNEGDIDEIIAIMGQPEDYTESEDTYADSNDYSYSKRNKSSNKKLFRDSEDKFLGGVASGLAHYTNIDTIWVRLFFILTAVTTGFGFLIYIVLWVLLPEAKTTAEKLQMEGEDVNIGNIEKKIRNEFEYLSTKLKDGASEITEKISSADYEKLRNQTKSGFQDFLDTLGKILSALFKVFGKFMGILLVFIAGIVLISLLFAMFSISSLEILGFEGDFVHYPPFFYDSVLPNWLLTLFGILLVAVPILALLILGLRILSPNLKRVSTTTSLSLFGIWLVSLFFIGFSGIEFATSKAQSAVKVSKKSILFNPEQPLKIGVQNDDEIYYQHNLRRRNNAVEVYVEDEKLKYSNDIKIDVAKSDSNEAYIEIKKESEGRKRKDAMDNAEKINYKFNLDGNKIVFDAFFLSEFKNLWKEEEVYLTVYIPEGTTVYFENSSKKFLYNIENTEDIYDRNMANHHFKMTSKGFECLDCEDDDSDDDNRNNSNWKNDNNNNNDNDNNSDVSFLFDSTINDLKAEFIISKQTSKNELNKLIKWFKNKRNIDIKIMESNFKNDKIEKILLDIDCNDGYKGELRISNNTLKNIPKGFRRVYDEKDSMMAFKIW
ncbi:PspC domain-containing protein [Tenacibaculum sp. MEBiC06402]|uniref:PspC domain-containing protein n=1 Tax=unclassified Tenacibaculum TaxID=2635139 RepID=UPI003B9A1FB6